MADTAIQRPLPLMARLIISSHALIYRLSNGKLWTTMGGAPVLLLKVRGRKSGKLHTLPLIYIKTDKGYAVVASRGGAPKHPAWYLNLEAAKEANIQIGSTKMPVKTRILMPDNPDYQKIWTDAVAVFPGYEEYKKNTSRVFPIVELLPQT